MMTKPAGGGSSCRTLCLVVVIGAVSLPACSGGDGADASASSGVTGTKTYALVADDGQTYNCPTSPTGNPNYDAICVKAATGEAYRCKVVAASASETLYHCIPTALAPDATADAGEACDGYHQFNDKKSGLQCWAPPENYCKNGSGSSILWWCSPDGATCCFGAGSCGPCGWVNPTYDAATANSSACKKAGENNMMIAASCEAFMSKLSAPYSTCVGKKGGCPKEVREAAAAESKCKDKSLWPDPSLIICP